MNRFYDSCALTTAHQCRCWKPVSRKERTLSLRHRRTVSFSKQGCLSNRGRTQLLCKHGIVIEKWWVPTQWMLDNGGTLLTRDAISVLWGRRCMRVLFECCDILESHRVFSTEVKVLCCDCDERRLKTFGCETFSAVQKQWFCIQSPRRPTINEI